MHSEEAILPYKDIAIKVAGKKAEFRPFLENDVYIKVLVAVTEAHEEVREGDASRSPGDGKPLTVAEAHEKISEGDANRHSGEGLGETVQKPRSSLEGTSLNADGGENEGFRYCNSTKPEED